MKLKYMFTILSIIIGFSFTLVNKNNKDLEGIKIVWVENLDGDFSFKEQWSYPEGVYKNEFGQLSCDGICPIETDRMKDENGKIYKDSLEAFYQLVDTTHIYHSIKSEAWTYEWAGTNFMNFTKHSDNTIKGQSECNVATHSSLNIDIEGDFCNAWIEFYSLGIYIFPLETGTIKIDKTLYRKGIIKAEFDLNFKNTVDPEKQIFWKGKIYTEIKKNENKRD
jgi:hypothetical protein